MKFRNEYIYNQRYGKPCHLWSALTDVAGIHLHITDLGAEYEDKYAGLRYSGGIEIHRRAPPDYQQGEPPTHDDCWLLKAPCWHDGSSLQATEFWIPRWLDAPHDHERMFGMLNRDLEERLAPKD